MNRPSAGLAGGVLTLSLGVRGGAGSSGEGWLHKACHLGSGSALQEALGFHLKGQYLGDSICKRSHLWLF